MRKGYIITDKEASDIFLILAAAKVKLTGKVQTAAINQYKKFEEGLLLLQLQRGARGVTDDNHHFITPPHL